MVGRAVEATREGSGPAGVRPWRRVAAGLPRWRRASVRDLCSRPVGRREETAHVKYYRLHFGESEKRKKRSGHI